jgi:hypothetical protein
VPLAEFGFAHPDIATTQSTETIALTILLSLTVVVPVARSVQAVAVDFVTSKAGRTKDWLKEPF